MGENAESQPQNVGFDDFYGFLSVSDMYTEWRDPYFFPEIVYSEERTRWIENQPFNKCFVHATKGGEPTNVEEVTIPVLSLLDDMWADYSIDFLRDAGRAATSRGSCSTAPAAPTSTTTRPRSSSGRRRPSTRTRTRSSSSTTSSAAWCGRCEETGQLEDTLDLRQLRQRSGDGDLARRRLLAVPQREGLDVGGRPAGPGRSSRGRG